MSARRKMVRREAGITIRFTQAEREALDAAAQAEDVSAATIVRRAVKQELERLNGGRKR